MHATRQGDSTGDQWLEASLCSLYAEVERKRGRVYVVRRVLNGISGGLARPAWDKGIITAHGKGRRAIFDL